MKSTIIILIFTVFILSSCKKATPDAQAATKTTTTTPIIIPPPPSGEFNAKFSYTVPDRNNIFEKQNIQLQSLGSNIVSYVWQLGNGTKVFRASPNISYNTHGIYNVTLTVKDEAGNTASCTQQITILCNFSGH